MMKSGWKKSFIIVAVLLVISITFNGGLGLRLEATEIQLYDYKAHLNTTMTYLEATKSQLVSTRSQLTAKSYQLQTTNSQLSTTKANLDAYMAKLKETQEELNVTKTLLGLRENERTEVNNRYHNLKTQINLRFGTGKEKQGFITSQDAEVANMVKVIAGSYSQDINEVWRDYERIYRWITKEIEYNTDSYTPLLPDIQYGALAWVQDFWRTPAETLKDRVGDCEDMATLLASMLLNYNQENYGVWLIGIESKATESQGESSRHLAAAIPVKGNRLTIFDPAALYYTGYPGGLTSSDVDIAVNRWLSHWGKEMPGAEIFLVFSDKLHREFSSTQEFLDWVQEQ
ncbi:transglutaminase-like domain-containing protein [Chloroflexota bacterium]